MFSVRTVINPPPHQEGHERWREMEQRCHGCRECPWCSVTLIIEQITHAQPDTSWSAQTAASVPHVILRHLEGVVSHSRQRSWSCTKVLLMGEAAERLEASEDADFIHGSERKKRKKWSQASPWWKLRFQEFLLWCHRLMIWLCHCSSSGCSQGMHGFDP